MATMATTPTERAELQELLATIEAGWDRLDDDDKCVFTCLAGWVEDLAGTTRT